MEKHEAEKLAKDLMEKHGVAQKGFTFAFNRRSRAAGLCSYRRKSIELSLPLTLHSNVEDVTDTILHEIAHAIAGRFAGHGPEWKRIAESIGCRALRCYGKEKKSTYEAMKMVAKYKGLCPSGHEHFRSRLPKRAGSCGECSPIFDERFIIKWSINR